MNHVPFPVCVLAAVVVSAQLSAGDQSALSKPTLTTAEAVAAARSKNLRSGNSFEVIRELDSSAATRDTVRRSAKEDSSSHIAPYKNGLSLNLLRTGGFLVLESDVKTGSSISLHLISTEPGGLVVVESKAIEGKVSANLAKELIKETADVVDLLLSAPLKDSMLEARFDDGHFPKSEGPEEESYFAIPRSIQEIGGDASATRDLSMLYGTFHLWPIRYAIATPMFPVDPEAALHTAMLRYEDLFMEFTHGPGENAALANDLEGLHSVHTADQIPGQIAKFRRLNDFLEGKLPAQNESSTFVANRSMSSLTLQLGSSGAPDGATYAVMTTCGVIVGWKQLGSGNLVVTRISLAGD